MGIRTALGAVCAAVLVFGPAVGPVQAQPIIPGSVALPELPQIQPVAVPLPLGSTEAQVPLLPFPFVWAADPFGGRTMLVDCSDELSKMPETIIIACGDGNLQYKNIRWDSWTNSEARGTAEMAYSDCIPHCYNGTFHRDPVAIRLHDVRVVNGVRAFTYMTVDRGGEVWEQGVSGFQFLV